MFVRLILNYIKGYVNILVEGVFIERFINICRSKNIYLWNMNRKKSTILYANISIEDFRKINKIAKQTKSNIKIKAKSGLPFIFYKYKKRKIFLLFLILVFIGILISSQFIWNIEINGTNKINPQELRQQVEESGLKIGENKKKVNINQVISDIRLKRTDIAWIGIELKGTNAVLQIVEADGKPEIVDYNDYCNIVSEKEGVITKISAQNGTPVVAPGAIIRKGDMLIGGWLEGKFTGSRYVHAIGNIEAKVWYSAKDKKSIKKIEKIQTGKKEKKYSIKINNFQINFYKLLTNFEKCDRIVENKKVKLFSNFYLPIELIKITNSEYKNEAKVYEEQELTKLILLDLEEKIKEQINPIDNLEKNILNKQVNTKKENDAIEVELVYEVLEKIGKEEKITI